MKKELTVVDIANFYLLSEKYKKQIEEAGINNGDDSKFFLEKCSKSISDQLKIMDDCQKMLYKFGYKKENIEYMRKVRNMFQDGIETMQLVLKSFDIVTSETPK